MIARLASAVRSMVTRAKVTGAAVGARTILQISGLDGETKATVELLLPPGYSARPLAGADVLALQVMGTRDHMVALGGDNAGVDAITSLAAGEFGLRNGAAGTQMVFRNSGIIEITGALHVSGAVIAGYGGADQVGLQTHTHPTAPSGPVSSPTAGS
jgi:phage gp45-like